jgi:hypothetical protein
MVVTRHQNGGRNHDLPTANKSSANVATFRHLQTAVTNENCIREKLTAD